MTFLKKDHLAIGALMATSISVVLYGILKLAVGLLPEAISSNYLREQSLILVSIFANLFLFRYYMIGLKLEKTGKGILLAMFVLMIVYFIFLH
jgi:hypothetical protein